jgi:hypothetical protein
MKTHFADVEFLHDLCDAHTLYHFLKIKMQQASHILLPLTSEEHGLIYWLGTDHHTREWRNPYEKVKVTTGHSMYPISNGGATTEQGLGRPQTTILFEKNSPDTLCTSGGDPYFLLDFGEEFSFSMTAYTLYCTYLPQNWFRHFRISISNDGKEFTTVKQHVKDMPSTWKCPETDFFRFLKIERTQTFSKQLLLSGIELYGTVVFRRTFLSKPRSRLNDEVVVSAPISKLNAEIIEHGIPHISPKERMLGKIKKMVQHKRKK